MHGMQKCGLGGPRCQNRGQSARPSVQCKRRRGDPLSAQEGFDAMQTTSRNGWDASGGQPGSAGEAQAGSALSGIARRRQARAAPTTRDATA